MIEFQCKINEHLDSLPQGVEVRWDYLPPRHRIEGVDSNIDALNTWVKASPIVRQDTLAEEICASLLRQEEWAILVRMAFRRELDFWVPASNVLQEVLLEDVRRVREGVRISWLGSTLPKRFYSENIRISLGVNEATYDRIVGLLKK